MKASIITVCYNSEKTIRETIDSVNNQSYKDLEHIFIDGHSSDSTLEIIKEFSRRPSIVVSEKDNGIYDAMNKGIKLSTGEIIFILNSDDIFYDNQVIEKIIKEFNLNPKIDILYGGILFSEENNIRKYIRYWMPTEYTKYSFCKGWHPPHPGFVVRKSVYRTEQFNTSFKIAADFELMYRFIEILNIPSLHYPDYVAILRYGGTSTNLKGIVKGMIEIKEIFRVHGKSIPSFYFFRRYYQKVIQFLMKKNKTIVNI